MIRYNWSAHRPGDDAAPAKNRGTPRRHAARGTTLALDRRCDAIRAEHRCFSRDAAAGAGIWKFLSPDDSTVLTTLDPAYVVRSSDPDASAPTRIFPSGTERDRPRPPDAHADPRRGDGRDGRRGGAVPCEEAVPAHAGPTRREPARCTCCKLHPCACGATERWVEVRERNIASSPRMRENPVQRTA